MYVIYNTGAAGLHGIAEQYHRSAITATCQPGVELSLLATSPSRLIDGIDSSAGMGWRPVIAKDRTSWLYEIVFYETALEISPMY